jgi:hypothetical protein
VRLSVAVVVRLAGRAAEAEAAILAAIADAEAKENLVGARLGREALRDLVEPTARSSA